MAVDPLPSLDCSEAIDEFMQATTTAGMRTAIGLGAVDDTADADKPVSTPQQEALDAVADEAAQDVQDLAIATTAALALKADAAATTAALDLKAPIDSPNLTGNARVPTVAPGTNSTAAASTAFVQAALSAAVAGLLNLKGSTDCSTNPNYPAAVKGDAYIVTVAGRIGGGAGKLVDVGDLYIASAANAGGTEAAVGASWFVLEHNLSGALLSANNLSDLANAATARTNLGLGNLDNTSDANKPVSTATQNALDLKADAAATTAALALKASTAALTAGLATKADDAATTAALALKASTAALTAGLALKADLTTVAGFGTAYTIFDTDRPSNPANAFDDDFEGAALNARWTGFRVATAGLTPVVAGGLLSATMSVAPAGDSKAGYVQAVTGDWAIVGRFRCFGGVANTCAWGLVIAGDLITNPTTAALACIQWRKSSADGVGAIEVANYTNATTFSAQRAIVAAIDAAQWIYFRMVKVGTNVEFQYSFDGVNWTVLSASSAIGFTTATAGIVMSRQTTGGSQFLGTADWIRKYASALQIGGTVTRFIAP